MISTTKAIWTTAFIVACFIFSVPSNAQDQKFIHELAEVAKKISFESASIRINNRNASYADVLKIPDSALLKLEVYPKKEAIKLLGKEEGRNGLMLITLRKGEMFQFNNAKKRGNYVYNDKGDSMYCEHITPAALNGDTTHNSWNKFLVKNLGASVPVENGCPPGIYNVDFSFIVGKDGTVKDIKIFEDPGYGCGNEVRRLMRQSPQWAVGLCENTTIDYKERQRITFVASEE